MNISETISHARGAVDDIIDYLNNSVRSNMEKFGFTLSKARVIDYDNNDRRHC